MDQDKEIIDISQVNEKPWGMDMKSFLLLMHLSQFGGYIIPGLGLILPIVMWATNKDEYPLVDKHGKEILNWIISAVIYGFVGFLLTFVLIGIPILIALAIMAVVFPIIGAIQANNGQFYKYPLNIRIIS